MKTLGARVIVCRPGVELDAARAANSACRRAHRPLDRRRHDGTLWNG